MYTLYTSMSKYLPTTSYMKAIEWWLQFNIMLPFLIFLVLFLKEHTARNMERKGGRRFLIDILVKYFIMIGEVVFPFIILFFVVIYAGIILMNCM